MVATVESFQVSFNDGVTAGAQAAADSMDRLTAAMEKAEAGAQNTDRAIQTRGQTLDNVSRRIDGQAAAQARAEAAERRYQAQIAVTTQGMQAQGATAAQIAEAVRRLTVIRDQDIARGNEQGQKIEQRFNAAAGAANNLTKEAERLAYANKAAAMQLTDVVPGLLTGQSAMQILLQQGGQVVSLYGGLGATFRGIVGALGPLNISLGVATLSVAALTASAEGTNRRMADLGQQLRATQADYATLATTVDRSARQLAASTTVSFGDASKALQSFASAKYFNGTSDDLKRLGSDAADLARVLGVSMEEATTILRGGLDDATKAAQQLAERGFRTMTPEVVRSISLLDAAGQRSQAFAKLLGTVEANTKGAAEAGLTPLQRALHELDLRFTSAKGSQETFFNTLGTRATDAAAVAVAALTKVIDSLDRVLTLYQKLPGGLGQLLPGALGTALAGANTAMAGAAAGAAPRYQVPSDAAVSYPGSPTLGGLTASPSQQAFLDTWGPVAQRAGAQLGIAATNILGQWALESGWGRSIYGNNPGNLTPGRGYGGATVVNPGDRREYRAYGSPEAFGSDYVQFMQASRYDRVRGTGADAGAYAAALRASGYAEDPAYQGKVTASISAVRARAPGLDSGVGAASGGMINDAKAAADAAAELVKGTRALKEQDFAAELQKIHDRMDAIPAAARATSAEYAGLKQREAEVIAGQYANVDAMTAAQRAAESQLRANEGLTEGERGLSAAIEARRQVALQAGMPFGSVEQQQATLIYLAQQGQGLQVLSVEMGRTIQNSAEMAAAYDKGGEAVVTATARQQAFAEAIKRFPDGAAEQGRAFAALIPLYEATARAAADVQTAQQNAQGRDNLAYIAEESRTLGENATQRAVELATLKATQAAHQKYGDTLTAEAQQSVALAGQITAATAAYAHQQQVINDVTGGIGGMVDQVGSSLVDALTKGEASGVSFNSVLQGLATSAGSLMVKLGLVNEVLNAIDGGSRTTLGLGSLLGLTSDGNTAGGLLGALFGGSSSSGGGWLAGALGLAGSFFGGKPSALSGPDTLAIGGAAKDFASAGTQQIASTAVNYAGLIPHKAGSGEDTGSWTDDVKQVGAVAKGLDWLSGGKLISGIKDAIGYQAGQSIGAYVSSLIGENVAASAASLGTNAVAASTTAASTVGLGSAAANTAGISSAAGVNAVGTIGSAVNVVAEALPYIGTAITVVTNLLQGNYRGAGLVAGGAVTGAVVGTYVFPGVGTAVGAAIGAALGGLADMLLPNHPKNPYLGVDIDVQGGKLVRGDVVAQLYKSRETTQAMEQYADAVNGYLDAVGVKIANPDGRIANLGKGIVGVDQLDKPQDVFKRLDFANANPDDTSNFGVAKGALAGKRFEGLQQLNDFLVQVAGFADGMDALGIHVSKVGSDLKQIEIGSVDGEGLSNLRTALAHDLPGKVFADQKALQDELQSVNNWVNGVLPSLLNPVFQAAPSDLEKQVADLAKTYQDAIGQAQAYGLATDALSEAQGRAIDLLRAPAVAQLEAQITGTRTALLRLQSGGANDNLRADLMDFDAAKPQQLAAFAKTMTDVFGPTITASQGFADRMAEEEELLGAQRLSIVQKYNQQIAAAQAAVSTGTMALWARLAKATGNDQEAELIAYDQSAAAERVQRSDQLKAAFGNGVTETQGYADEMLFVERVQGAERLAIVKKYSDQAVATEKAAADERAAAIKAAQGPLASNITGITSFLHGLQLGDQSTLSGADKLGLATRQFDAVAGAARAGNTDSIAQFQSYAQDYLTASRDYNATGPGYSEAMDRVLGVAADLAGLSADTLTADAMQRIADKQAADTANPVVEAISGLREELQGLRAENRALRLRLDGMAQAA